MSIRRVAAIAALLTVCLTAPGWSQQAPPSPLQSVLEQPEEAPWYHLMAQAPQWQTGPMLAPSPLSTSEPAPIETLPTPSQPPVPPGAAVVPEVAPQLAAPAPPPKLWEGSVEFGLNGSQGNSEVFNFRLGANGKRKTPDNELSLSLLYLKNTQDGKETAHRAFGEGRNEWLAPNSPWTRYVHGTGEYDEFRAFDVRIAGDAGWGYAFVKNPVATLIGRFGPGFSQEIGGPDDSLRPEAVLGLEYEHKLTERQKITASTLFYPDLGDLGEYRLNSKAAWELLIDPVWNLSLKLSLLDRYDSTPAGAKPNDLDYGLLFVWCY